jgi:hypothetical protein
MSTKDQQDAAKWVVDATAKVSGTPAPDAPTRLDLDIATHAAKTVGTTPDQIAAAANNRR